jgi:hypothetical protein
MLSVAGNSLGPRGDMFWYAYLVTQGRGMAERNAQQAQQARDQLRHVVGFSVADEITKLDQLKKSGSITDAEFGQLRAKLVS